VLTYINALQTFMVTETVSFRYLLVYYQYNVKELVFLQLIK